MSRTEYGVLWDNGHASGTLYQWFDNEEAAEDSGKDWHLEMVAADDDLEAAEEAYSWEVISREIPDEDDEPEEDEMALLQKAGLSRGQP